ncbi:MAG: hypothetical protein JOY98_10470, partial [Candidatus Eremiobacteraeota bacterium]|nr:hypothetical protein [Candidatus Eremiobacteraeota bacterium]
LASGVTQTHGQSVGALTQMVSQQSAMIAYDYLFGVTAIVFVLSAPLVFFIRPQRGAPSGQMAMASE